VRQYTNDPSMPSSPFVSPKSSTRYLPPGAALGPTHNLCNIRTRHRTLTSIRDVSAVAVRANGSGKEERRYAVRVSIPPARPPVVAEALIFTGAQTRARRQRLVPFIVGGALKAAAPDL
jgi:hypothetical protein